MAAASIVGLHGSISQAVTITDFYVQGQIALDSSFTTGVQNVSLSGSSPMVSLPVGDYFRFGVASVITGNPNISNNTPANLGLAQITFANPQSQIVSVNTSDTHGAILTPVLGASIGSGEFDSTAAFPTNLKNIYENGDIVSGYAYVGVNFPISVSVNDFNENDGSQNAINRLGFAAGTSATVGQATTIFNNLAYQTVTTGNVNLVATISPQNTYYWLATADSQGNVSYSQQKVGSLDALVDVPTLSVNIGQTIFIYSNNTVSVSTNAGIGNTSQALQFSGGILATTASFNAPRATTISSLGGGIDIAPGTTFGIGGATALTWSGGTLSITNTGILAISQTTGPVAVTSGSALNIAANSSVSVTGSTDPFTDSTTTANHVAIVNNGTLTVKPNAAVAGITGNGALIVGDQNFTRKLTLATSSGLTSLGSLQINTGASLDIGNNHVIIQNATDPRSTILTDLHNGDLGGGWNGTGIVSMAAASNGNYGIGYADGVDHLNPSLTSGQLEVAYTLNGDITLQGVVSTIDFGILAGNFGKVVTGGWAQGDLNYDGVVNATDFGMLSTNFGKADTGTAVALPSADWAALDSFAANQGLLADVPEPATAGILLLATMEILSSRLSRRVRML